MADEFNTTINWRDSSSTSSKIRFYSICSSSSSTTNNNNNSGFGWPRSFINSSSSDNLHMMGLGLSSTSLNRNQSSFGGDKLEGSFRQENMNSTSSYRGFSVDQTQFSPHGGGSSSDSTVTCQGLLSCFQMDSSSNIIFQVAGILGPDNQNNSHYGAVSNNISYGMNKNTSYIDQVPDQFLRTCIPKQLPQHTHHLHFSNNAPFWNASAGSSMKNVPSPNFFPSLQTPHTATQSFDEKPKHHVSGVRDTSSIAAKNMSGSEHASKRAKNNQTASPSQDFKMRKEKMGDRISALQQLVSPFGKTNTASVLSEAIEYIKFLHEQVAVLSTPYMKSGAPTPHKQNLEKVKYSEGPKQDLRRRGLCLVPVSSTFPAVTHETTVDFWTPTFGGAFR